MEPFAIYNAIRNKLVVAGAKMQIPNRCVSLLMSINYFLMKSKDYAGSGGPSHLQLTQAAGASGGESADYCGAGREESSPVRKC